VSVISAEYLQLVFVSIDSVNLSDHRGRGLTALPQFGGSQKFLLNLSPKYIYRTLSTGSNRWLLIAVASIVDGHHTGRRETRTSRPRDPPIRVEFTHRTRPL
jgi:hypothetical protein